MSDEPEVTKESLLAAAADFDAGKLPEDAPAPAVDVEDDKPSNENEEQPEEKAEEGEKDGEVNKAKTQENDADKHKSKQAKNEARKNQTWEQINARKAEIEARDAAVKAEREALQREREEFQRSKNVPEALRDEHGATAKDYREAAKKLLAKGDSDLAEAAEKLASNLEAKEQGMRQERTLREGQERWAKNLADLTAKHPELAKPDSDLSKAALQVLENFPMLKKDPDGIKYAVRAAEIELQAKNFDGTKAELAKLKAEHEKLQKKLSISGGSPTDPLPESKGFNDLSSKERHRALEQAVAQADRENGL